MPHYEFFCNSCKKTFSKLLTIADHERQGNIKCPNCGSHKIEQRWAAFYAVTTKKSA
jgi:putative FmdB family regulatory protein